MIRITYGRAGAAGNFILIMSMSALAITEEHQDLAASAIGRLQRSGSRAAARATLDQPGS